MRASDPAMAAMQLPAIGAAFEPVSGENTADPNVNPGAERLAALKLRFSVQTQMGVTQPRLLTRAEAGRLAARLTGMEDGRVAALRDLEQSYGDLYPALMTELGDRKFSGLPPRLKLLATVAGADAPPVLANKLDQALATDDATNHIAGFVA